MKFVQAWFEHSRTTGRISSRSALASATVSLASICGAEPGNTITAVPYNERIAKAERDLTILNCLGLSPIPLRLGIGDNNQPDDAFLSHERSPSNIEVEQVFLPGITTGNSIFRRSFHDALIARVNSTLGLGSLFSGARRSRAQPLPGVAQMHAFSNFRRHRAASTSVNFGIAAAVALLLGATVGSASAEPGSAGAEVLRTGGPGAVSKILQRVGAAFTEREPATTLMVIPNLGSAGAIAGVADGLLDFGVSGRPLKPEEAKSLTAVILASTPFGLASSQPNPGSIKSADVAAFYQNAKSVWPDGTPVRVVLRPRAEVDAALLVNTFPNMAPAIEQLRERAEIPLVATDHDNVLLAEKIPGSLAAVTLTQVLTENSQLHFVAIDGVEPTLENFERGAYPYRKDFYFVFSHSRKPAVERFIAFLRSADGEKLLRESGNLAPRP